MAVPCLNRVETGDRRPRRVRAIFFQEASKGLQFPANGLQTACNFLPNIAISFPDSRLIKGLRASRREFENSQSNPPLGRKKRSSPSNRCSWGVPMTALRALCVFPVTEASLALILIISNNLSTAFLDAWRHWRLCEVFGVVRSRAAWEEACAHFMRCVFPARGQAEGLRYLTCQVGPRTRNRCAPQQSCGMSRCGAFHEIVRQPVSKTAPHKSIRKRQDKSKQAHNLAHQPGCNILVQYFDLLLTNTYASC